MQSQRAWSSSSGASLTLAKAGEPAGSAAALLLMSCIAVSPSGWNGVGLVLDEAATRAGAA